MPGEYRVRLTALGETSEQSFTVRLDPRGKVQVFEGDAPGGQGHETSMAQVVAYEFGIHPNDVTVMHGDTSTTPFGSGTIGARAGSYTVSAISTACRVLYFER